MKFFPALLVTCLLFTNFAYADGTDIYYAQTDIFTRSPLSPAKVAVAPVPISSGEFNVVYVDELIDYVTGVQSWRFLFVDESNQVMTTTTMTDNSGGGQEEHFMEASPLGLNAVWTSWPSELLFTADSGLTWNTLTLPTSSTHKIVVPFNAARNNPAKFDQLGYLNVFYHTDKGGTSSTSRYQSNLAVFDRSGTLINHVVLATQNSGTALFVEVTQTLDKVVAIVSPGVSWTSSTGVVTRDIPTAFVWDPVTQTIVEQSSIGTFPTDPDAAIINPLMHFGEQYLSNIITSDGQALYSLTRSSDHTDAFGTKSDSDLIRFDYNSTTGFFPDHGSAGGNSALCDLKQMPSFKLHNIMDRTISGNWEGVVFHMAAKRFSAGQTPDLTVDLAYLTPDDFENGFAEFKRVRITDPNAGGTNILVENVINDYDCSIPHRGILGCSVSYDNFFGSFSGVEGWVVGSYQQSIITRKGALAALFGIDIF